MRQIIVHVPRGRGSTVKELAADLDAIGTISFEGSREGEPVDVVLAHVSNQNVGPLLERLEAHIEGVHASFYPMGVLALKPPPEEAADQVTDVQPLSSIEVFLAGHQSVGSWRGFLGYAAIAGAVAWVGLYISNTYLLTAAMLVAPFAGPAMNAAIATASGEVPLLRRSITRYFAALGVTIAATFVLTLLIGPESPSRRMILESQVSSIAVVLPLVAGAAGALFLQSSERSSLVSGAAVGLLVAASLAPPAGVVGMAVALGRWDMATSAAFVLGLQLVGIHFTGAIVFRLFGLSHDRSRHGAGRRKLFPFGLTATALVLAGLLTLQFYNPVNLNRTTLAQDIASTIETELSASSVRAEHVETQFMKTKPHRPPVLLARLYVRRPHAVSPQPITSAAPGPANEANMTPADANVTPAALDSTADALTAMLHDRLREKWPQVSPLIDWNWVAGR